MRSKKAVLGHLMFKKCGLEVGLVGPSNTSVCRPALSIPWELASTSLRIGKYIGDLSHLKVLEEYMESFWASLAGAALELGSWQLPWRMDVGGYSKASISFRGRMAGSNKLCTSRNAYVERSQ